MDGMDGEGGGESSTGGKGRGTEARARGKAGALGEAMMVQRQNYRQLSNKCYQS